MMRSRRQLLASITILIPMISPSAAEVPSAIVADGVPPIPEEVARQLGRYQNFRSASFGGWHPVRREMLIGTRFADTTQVHHLAMPLGARRQLTFFPERCSPIGFDPRPDQENLLFSMDAGGSEDFQLYRLDRGGGEVTLLTDGRSRNGGVAISPRSGRIAFYSTARNGRDWDLYGMDPADPSTRRMIREASGPLSPLDWSPDDRYLLVLQPVSVVESYLHVLDPASGGMELLTPAADPPVYHGEGRFDHEGKAIYFISDRGSELRRVHRMDLATRREAPVPIEVAGDVESIDLSPDGRTLAFTVNEGGFGALRLYDLAAAVELPRPAHPPGVLSGVRFHPRRAEVAFAIQSARSPGDVYSYDLDAGALTRWTESEAGGMDAGALPQPAAIRYPTFDRVDGSPRMLAALLTLPPPRFAGPRPVLVEVHGGPEGQSRPGFEGRDNYYVNELGIALLRPNVRGSTGYGRSFVALDDGRKREDAVRDLGALLDWVATRPDLDARRVCVTGGSYGGYMALAAAVHFGDRLRCAIDTVGISSFVTFLENTRGYRQDLRRVEYGDERDPAMREFLGRISPLAGAGRIGIPLLVAQGANDPRVPRSEAEQIVAKVRASGSTVWYVLAMDEGHGFAKKANADYLQHAVVMFLREFLMGSDLNLIPGRDPAATASRY